MDPKLEPGAYVALTPGLDLTLVEQPEVLPVKLLRVGVLTALEAFVLIVETICRWSLGGCAVSGGDRTVAPWLSLFRRFRRLNIGFIISGIN